MAKVHCMEIGALKVRIAQICVTEIRLYLFVFSSPSIPHIYSFRQFDEVFRIGHERIVHPVLTQCPRPGQKDISCDKKR
jgi:hypothetical protein